MAKVCSELARGFVRKSTNDKVRSEIVRLFGVYSEFVRSSFGVRSEFVRSSFGVRSEFGVCSELFGFVHGELGASEKRLPRKKICSVLCSAWPKPKNASCKNCCRSLLSL